MELNQSDLEQSVINRTVALLELGGDTTEQDILEVLGTFGEIQYIRLDSVAGSSTKVALVQFVDESVAQNLVRKTQIRIRSEPARVRQSAITIEVIPPTDAVFGKPMTVGRHVMAVNLSRDQRTNDSELRAKTRRVRESIRTVLHKISSTTGWTIPSGAFENILPETEDNPKADWRETKSRSHSIRGSRSRSRSSGRSRRVEPRYSHRR